MFKKIAVIASGFMCIVSLVACASGGDSSVPSAENATPTIQKIKDAGKLVIATSADYPPFETHEVTGTSDEITGWDIQLAQKVADKLGVTLEIQDINFDTILASLQSGQSDFAIAGMGTTEERDQAFDHSDVYYDTKNILLTTKENASVFSTPESISGKKIGTQIGTLQADLIKDNFPDVNIVEQKKTPDLINGLKSGSLDGVLLDSSVAVEYVENNPTLAKAELNFDSYPGALEGKVIYFQKGKEDLKTFLNEVIAESAPAIYPKI